MKTVPNLAWAADWPLPSWLGKLPESERVKALKVSLSGGREHEGVLLHAAEANGQLAFHWAGLDSPMVVRWDDLVSVTRVSPLLLAPSRSHPGDEAALGIWDSRIPRKLVPFQITLNSGLDLQEMSGYSLGYLPGSGGLYLYVQQPDGRYLAIWLPKLALGAVQLGLRHWQARDAGSARPAPPAAAEGLDSAEVDSAAGPVLSNGIRPVQQRPPVTSIPQAVGALEHLLRVPVERVEDIVAGLGFVSVEDLNQHLLGASRSGHVLGDLIKAGLLDAGQSHRVLARMAALPEVDLKNFQIQADADALNAGDARRYRVCPLGAAAGIFFVASSTPTQKELVQVLSSLLNRTVLLVWASAESIDERLARIRPDPMAAATGPMSLPGELQSVSPAPAPDRSSADAAPTLEIEQLLEKAVADVNAGLTVEQVTAADDSSNFVVLVKRIIQDAQALGASDIHIETNPGQKATRVRFRRDGDLETYLELPAPLRAPVVSRIKVMARLDIAERRRPQDGKINFSDFGGSKLELRVAVLPTHDGLEDVVMRLLASSKPIPLARLGFQPRDEKKIMAMAARSYGLILAAGPTGSGKTTTLHSMLKELNTDRRKVWTAEDPIEITQDGLRQVQVNPKIGVTFASAMRAFLRADPDVIMIGEIRDDETAKIAVEASLTGHLVLSTLHTNNAAESVVRLLDLGMDPMNFADSLVGIVAQRLVRALCQQCAEPTALAPQALDDLIEEYRAGSVLDPDEARRRLTDAAVQTGDAASFSIWKPVGCPQCGGKGYKGRLGIYEVLENDAILRALIQQRARPTEVFEAATRSGMHSLRHDALEKVLQGRVDLEQARSAYA